ncbi:DNA internalization-related competence protein ComEC/Rec2 [Vagococcus xieshaowenii]|nr:DNA internalization-related competence protein ComEC/Rec2 [Vagococcus xieshaowenii]
MAYAACYFQVVIVWVLLGIMITRVITTRQHKLIISSLVGVAFSACFFVLTDHEVEQLVATPQTWQTVIQPETLTIKGDYLQFNGKTPRLPGESRYRYQLKSKEEKEKYQQVTQQTIVRITGVFSLPKGPQNLNGFDTRRYLSEQGIYRLVDIDELQVIGLKKSWSPLAFFRHIRSQLLHYVDHTFGYYTRLYVKSLLLGYKGEEFSNEREAFEKLGIMYLFSLSGMHVSFFAGMWKKILRRTPLALEWIDLLELGYLFALYVLFGESIAVLRALLAYVIVTRNRHYRLGFSSLDCWSLSLLVSFLLKPTAVFSIGGIYSFYLTFGLIYLHSAIKQYWKSGWRQSLAMSLGLACLSFPLNSYFFYENRLLSFCFSFFLLPIMCQVVLPLIVATLLLPFATTSVEGIFQGIHLLFRGLGNLPILHIVTGKIPLMVLLLSVGCLVLSLILLATNWRKSLALVGIMLVSCCSYKWLNYQGIVAFVNVGQGDCLVIQEPFHGKVMVIDVGGRMAFEKEEWQQSTTVAGVHYTLLPFLKSRGITQIDALCCTHADDDHVGDLVAVVEAVNVRQLVFPKGLETNASFYKKLRSCRQPIVCKKVLDGDVFKVGKMTYKVLSPKQVTDGGNDDSLVLYSSIGGQSFLFTGDLEAPGEQALLNQYPDLTVDVLKVGHHGSKTSTTLPFVKQLQPDLAIISCGENNRFGHPHPDVLQTLLTNTVETHRLDQEGMIYSKWSGLSGKLSKFKGLAVN